MPKQSCYLSATLGLVLISASLHALAPDRLPSQYLYEHFGREQGLPADVIWDIEQDHLGYLWLGSQNGLVRFDGVRFVTYNNLNWPIFGSNDVRSLLVAEDDRLWIGTYGGGVLIYDHNTFESISAEEGLPHDVVYDIAQDKDGAIWLATGGGVSRVLEGEITTWTTEDGLISNRVFRVVVADDGTLWFATFTSGISHFDGQQFTNYSTENGLQSNQLHMLEQLDDGRLLAGSYDGCIYDLSSGKPVMTDRGALPDEMSMQTVLMDNNQTTWIGSYGQGLWRKSANGIVRAFGKDNAPGSHIFELFQDREGSLWVGTMRGLYRFKDSSFELYGQPEGVSDSTFVLTQAPETGRLWVGTEMDGLLEIATDTELNRQAPLVSSRTTDNGLASNSVSALLFDSEGRQWVGTFGQGLHVFTDESEQLLTQADGLASNHIFALAEDADGAIWIGAQGGLSTFKDGEITTVSSEQRLPYRLIRHILITNDNTIWLSSNDGLVRKQGDQFTLWNSDDGLASNLITISYQDQTGTLWLGSRNGGLARLVDDSIFQFNSEHGLPRQSAMSIIEDDQQRLWISTNDGLIRVPIADLNAVADGHQERVNARLFDSLDGLRSTQFISGFMPSSIKSSDGRLWFPTNKGLVGVDPDLAEQSPTSLNILIEAVRVNGDVIDLNALTPDQTLQLPASTSTLEIEYTTPVLSIPERIAFRYRMSPLDSAWQEAGARRTAYFTSLKPGNHQFQVEAFSSDSSFNSTIQTLDIYRAPFWYQRGLIQLLGLAGLLLLAFAAYRLALGQTKRRQLLLEGLVEQRTIELQQALEKVKVISRVDGLTGVFNRRYFEEMLLIEWSAATTSMQPISLILVDIDRFKQYNDLHGHQMGDETLRKVACSLADELMRKRDVVARYGGEEFVILLPDTNEQAAFQIAERVRNGILEMRLPHGDSDVSDFITISAGCATASPGKIETATLLVEQADQALYKAKREGRNRVMSDF